MNPYPSHAAPPFPHGMPPMMPHPGAAVMSAPPMMHPSVGVAPQPYVPANWHQRLQATPATQPLTVYIGKIPSDLEHLFFVKILEACGPIQKLNRPEDIKTKQLKGFAFCTFTQGTAALRCRNVLDGLEIGDGNLEVKAGTKETTSLSAIEASEAVPDATEGGEAIDATAKYDAPVRERVYTMLSKYIEAGGKWVEEEKKSDEGENGTTGGDNGGGAVFGDGTLTGEDERERQVLKEIEKFRARQAQRDKELEARRAEKVAAKLREFEEAQQSSSSTAQTSGNAQAEKDRRERDRDSKSSRGNGAAVILNNKRDAAGAALSEEDAEAKRIRKQQVLAMMSGSEGEANAPGGDASTSLKTTSSKLVLKTTNKSAAKRAGGGFAGDDDNDDDSKPRRAIVPIDYTEEERQALHFTSDQQATDFLNRMNREQQQSVDPEAAKKKRMKEMVDSIPTARDKLFEFPVDWQSCEKYDVVKQSMKSWVVKKFVEYLGEEEPSLTNFILTKLAKRCHPEELLTEMMPVLDKDAESFVLKLWRMLIFNVMKASMDASA